LKFSDLAKEFLLFLYMLQNYKKTRPGEKLAFQKRKGIAFLQAAKKGA